MYKNWKAICQISDGNVMWAFALLDLDSDLGSKFIEKFPEYFTENRQLGPVPLSIMKEVARRKGSEQGVNSGDEYIYSYGGVPADIPIETFDLYGNFKVGDGFPRKLPKEIRPDAKAGEVVTWKSKQFVVLERNENCEELYIAPAELVYVDC